MEALSQNFVTEDSFKHSNLKNNKADLSSCWVLIDPASEHKVTNTDIVLCINDHHKSLADDQEVGVKIKHRNKEIVFYIDHIAHQNQSMIYFKGHTENNKQVHFVKHSSELKIELQALERRAPETSKMPFGFADWNAYEKFKRLQS